MVKKILLNNLKLKNMKFDELVDFIEKRYNIKELRERLKHLDPITYQINEEFLLSLPYKKLLYILLIIECKENNNALIDIIKNMFKDKFVFFIGQIIY